MAKVFRFSDIQIKVKRNRWRIDFADDEGNLKEKMYCLDINDIFGLEIFDYINEVGLRIFTKIPNQDIIYVPLYKWDDATPDDVMEKNIKVRKEFLKYFFDEVENF